MPFFKMRDFQICGQKMTVCSDIIRAGGYFYICARFDRVLRLRQKIRGQVEQRLRKFWYSPAEVRGKSWGITAFLG